MDFAPESIKCCRICSSRFIHEPRPVLQFSAEARIVIIGQAPGRKVHETGKPWNDQSGQRLRDWLGVEESLFYDPLFFAHVPMAFCYPGKGKSGDLPPSAICAPTWHHLLFQQLINNPLYLLVGSYSQKYYLPDLSAHTLEYRVATNPSHFPYLCLPHPSPRNIAWFKKNRWFESDVLPELKNTVQNVLIR